MLRSAAVPGWGQVVNHDYLKAAGVVAVEGFLGYSALHAWRQELDATDRASARIAADDEPGYFRYLADRDRHANTKINFIWWGLAAHALSMLDAYVAANLATFDADFGPPNEALGRAGGPRFTLALRARF